MSTDTGFEVARRRFGQEMAARDEARRKQAEAEAAARAAQAEVKDIERRLPEAKRAAETAVADLEGAIKAQIRAAEGHLHRGEQLSQSAERPTLEVRKLARSWLLGGTVVGDDALIGNLTQRDPAIGAFHEVLRLVDQIAWRVVEQGLSDKLVDAVDDLGCKAWTAQQARLRWLAGES